MHRLQLVLQEALNFEYLDGEAVVAAVYPESTGWRQLPFTVAVHIVSGETLLEIHPAEGRVAGVGNALIIPPGCQHRISLTPNGGGLVSSWSHLRFSLFGSVDLFSFLDVPPVLAGPVAQEIGEIHGALAELALGRRENMLDSVARQKALGFHFLSAILAELSFKPGWDTFLESASRLSPVLRYIRENLARGISRGELASMVYLSPTRFHAVFKNATGLAPMDYVKRLRLKEAQLLLARTDDAIAEVGRRVGYRDPFHFSRLFKAFCGMSPLEYRGSNRWLQGRPV
ncbi:MAG: helix-turn-helix transcriptional regulator [Planctomycetes bacterium]|nr:helix-turn-helix transcriptional regulator [Planctomycetota bacterium]